MLVSTGGVFAQLRLDPGAADIATPPEAEKDFYSICIRNRTVSQIEFWVHDEKIPPRWDHYVLEPGAVEPIKYFSRNQTTISYYPDPNNKETPIKQVLNARQTTRDSCDFATIYEFSGRSTKRLKRLWK